MAAMMKSYFVDRGEEPWPEPEMAPENNEPVVVFLLSDHAADVNGQVVRIEGNDLSLMTHPSVLFPPLTRNRWTAEGVREAFASDLGARMLPLGVVALEATVRDRGATYMQEETERLLRNQSRRT
jgi:hypothetical protein